MNAVQSISCKPSCFRGDGPQLLAAPAKRTVYRRAVTTKAPRKRTFVNLIMTKYNPGSIVAVGAGTFSTATAAANREVFDVCLQFGGNNGNGMGNSGSGFGGNGGFDGANNSGSGDGLPRATLIGAVVLAVACVLLPGMPSSARTMMTQISAASSPVRRATLCLNADPSDLGHRRAVPKGAIPYGYVELSAGERRMMRNRQIHFRETLRAEAVRI